MPSTRQLSDGVADPAEVREVLSDPGARISLLAPTDDAWRRSLLRTGTQLSAFLSDSRHVGAVVLSHILPAVLSGAALEVSKAVDTMLLGTQVLADGTAGGTLLLSLPGTEAAVTQADNKLCQVRRRGSRDASKGSPRACVAGG